MKNLSRIGAYGLMVGAAAIIAGCASEKIMVDYTMPARKVADVSKINVVKINVKADVRGSLAGDNAQNAALVRQLISERLYKSGFYRVTDDIWGVSSGADKTKKLLADSSESGHGYVSFATDGGVPADALCPKCGTICPDHKDTPQGMKVKAQLDVVVDLELNAVAEKKEIPITLETTPYVPAKVKDGMPPTSAPNVAAIQKRTEKHPVKYYTTVAKGKITAKISGIDGDKAPVDYSGTFVIGGKDAKPVTSYSAPTQLKAFAEAVSPAVLELVADIAPYKVTKELVAIEGGNEDVVTLLEATAFGEVIEVVTELARSGRANFADYENLGIALEASGRFDDAKKAFKKAVKANPESATAKAGLKRVEDALSGKAVVAKSGKANSDTKFSK